MSLIEDNLQLITKLDAHQSNAPYAVLLIEEDNECLNQIQQTLQADGFRVDQCRTVCEAIASIDRWNYVAILLDLNLPDEEAEHMLATFKIPCGRFRYSDHYRGG